MYRLAPPPGQDAPDPGTKYPPGNFDHLILKVMFGVQIDSES